jgi:hypothetical protein
VAHAIVANADEQQEKIDNIFASISDEGENITELVLKTGYSTYAVRRAINWLVSVGEVARSPNGRYWNAYRLDPCVHCGRMSCKKSPPNCFLSLQKKK